MVLNHQSARTALLPPNSSVSVLSAPSVLRKTCAKLATRSLFSASCPIPFDSKLSILSSLCVKSFRIRTSSKNSCNPFRIRTFKTLNLNCFRMRSYKKNGTERGPFFPNKPSVRAQ